MEAEIGNLRAQLTQSQNHVATLGQALDTLRNESSAAVARLEAAVTRLQAGGGQGEAPRRQKLLNLKNFQPKLYTGRDDDNFKEWTKSMLGYCNAQRKGYRAAMEWSEMSKEPIKDEDLGVLHWDEIDAANNELYVTCA